MGNGYVVGAHGVRQAPFGKKIVGLGLCASEHVHTVFEYRRGKPLEATIKVPDYQSKISSRYGWLYLPTPSQTHMLEPFVFNRVRLFIELQQYQVHTCQGQNNLHTTKKKKKKVPLVFFSFLGIDVAAHAAHCRVANIMVTKDKKQK